LTTCHCSKSRMAETAGLIIGTVSLASLFTNCVDCYTYIRIGQGLEDEFPIYQTELDILELRFSRWAQAVTELSIAKSPVITDDVAPLVERILKQIAKLFQRAQEDAEEYGAIESQKQGVLVSAQNPTSDKIHKKLKALIHRRQKFTKGIGFGDKVQWALYKREEFVTLIVNVRNKVNDLEKLIPALELKESLVRMRLQDAEEVKSDDEEDQQLLSDTVGDVDPALGVAVEQVRSGHNYSNTEIAELARVQMGDSFAAGHPGPISKAYNSYNYIRVGRSAVVSMGTMYGRTVFDKD
jgi:hypothetical protein